jgi:hypothetical protein
MRTTGNIIAPWDLCPPRKGLSLMIRRGCSLVRATTESIWRSESP